MHRAHLEPLDAARYYLETWDKFRYKTGLGGLTGWQAFSRIFAIQWDNSSTSVVHGRREEGGLLRVEIGSWDIFDSKKEGYTSNQLRTRYMNECE